MESLGQMEAGELPSADEPATAFGNVLAELFGYGLDETSARIARHVGLHIGRWLYLIDAIDDYGEDVRRHRPNALHRLYQTDELCDQTKKDLLAVLLLELKQAADAVDLIDIPADTCGVELSPLLYHMLQVALPQKTEAVLFPATAKSQEKVKHSL